ncbi:KamA family radical SAM protein [Sulfurihydrogenibium sp.]|uniref:KamA family radical SAM protein n=1 Tax=Sulfurihydrogenibium sp. TaxID=2053621 RepID=UPI00261284B7|nr:KamA family radical SAM protein [Sulfurihydrogenibium sp.]
MQNLEENFWQKIHLYKNISKEQWQDWKWQIANRITSLNELKQIIPIKNEEDFLKISQIFHFGTTPYYISLINPKDENDPILKQILPDIKEIDEKYQEGAFLDPFLEDVKSPVPGLTHRYPDRVLFRATNFCSVYCRHCMRKRMFLEDERARTKEEYDAMFEYIRNNKSIKEVLISGGDPLTLPNKKIEYILKNLYEISHIDIIRIGSRELVVNPYRFYDEKLLQLFEKYDKVWLITHFNHPNEITSETKKAVKNILSTGTPVLNQTVLLKGINDSKETIENLMRDLLKAKIKPYYLFQCDPTKGVYHFRTPLEVGLEIMEYLRGRLSGLGIPTFAVDLLGGFGKVPVLPNYIIEKNEDYIVFRNYENKTVKVKI